MLSGIRYEPVERLLCQFNPLNLVCQRRLQLPRKLLEILTELAAKSEQVLRGDGKEHAWLCRHYRCWMPTILMTFVNIFALHAGCLVS